VIFNDLERCNGPYFAGIQRRGNIPYDEVGCAHNIPSLGTNIRNSKDHVAAITSKAAKRLCFMKQLKKAGVSQDDLMFYYQSFVRPVLEYACPVLALEPNQGTDETTSGCSTLCASGHFR